MLIASTWSRAQRIANALANTNEKAAIEYLDGHWRRSQIERAAIEAQKPKWGDNVPTD